MWEKIKGIDIAFFIFILTGLGYLITFLYEWGYNNYYYLPVEFIELTIPNITKSIVMIGIIYGLGFLNNMFLDKETDLHRTFKKLIFPSIQVNNPKINRFYQLLCIFGLIGTIYVYFKYDPDDKILFFVVTLIFIYLYCILKKYNKILIALGICFLLILPFYTGNLIANQKTNYLFINNEIVIRIDESKIITAKYEKEKNLIIPDYTLKLVDTLADESISLQMKKVKNIKVSRP